MPQYTDINTSLSDLTSGFNISADLTSTLTDYDQSGEQNLWGQLGTQKSLMSSQMGTGATKIQESVGMGFSGSGQRQKLQSDMSEDMSDKYGGMLDNTMYDAYRMKKDWREKQMDTIAGYIQSGDVTVNEDSSTGDDDTDTSGGGDDDFVPSGYSGDPYVGETYTDEDGLVWVYGGNNRWNRQGGSCFVKGTKIFMSNGSERDIQDIIEGDLILSFDEKTKSFIPGVVTESLIHPVMMDVPVAIVGGILEGTPSHPIFFNGSWSEIKESEVDTKIVKKYIDNYYNLEVDAHDIFGSSHNYIANGYVVSGLGDNDVLNIRP